MPKKNEDRLDGLQQKLIKMLKKPIIVQGFQSSLFSFHEHLSMRTPPKLYRHPKQNNYFHHTIVLKNITRIREDRKVGLKREQFGHDRKTICQIAKLYNQQGPKLSQRNS